MRHNIRGEQFTGLYVVPSIGITAVHSVARRLCPHRLECLGRIGTVEPGRVVNAELHGFQNPCDGMRNARLKREDAFSHAMIIVNSAMVSSS